MRRPLAIVKRLVMAAGRIVTFLVAILVLLEILRVAGVL